MHYFKFLPVALFLSSAAFATPAQVLIIRHGEKPADGNELSPRGWERAKALVEYFKTNPAVTEYGTPVAIYAMGQKDNGSVRPIQTVTPLANELSLKLNTSYTRDELDPLVKEIMKSPAYEGKMVLICWEHKVINNMVQDFGVAPKPDNWPGEVFDQVWEINFSGDKVKSFLQFSQRVLPGDGTEDK